MQLCEYCSSKRVHLHHHKPKWIDLQSHNESLDIKFIQQLERKSFIKYIKRPTPLALQKLANKKLQISLRNVNLAHAIPKKPRKYQTNQMKQTLLVSTIKCANYRLKKREKKKRESQKTRGPNYTNDGYQKLRQLFNNSIPQ